MLTNGQFWILVISASIFIPFIFGLVKEATDKRFLKKLKKIIEKNIEKQQEIEFKNQLRKEMR